MGDSDDVIEPYTVEECINLSQELNVESVTYGYALRINGVNRNRRECMLTKQVYRGVEIVNEMMPWYIGLSFSRVNDWVTGNKYMKYGQESNACWHMMFDTRVIRENNLLFDTNLSLGEDTKYLLTYMLLTESIGYLDKPCYYLTQRKTGANWTSAKNYIKRCNDKIKMISVRKDIEKLAMDRYRVHIHSMWEGTLVFSVMELAVKMSRNQTLSSKENLTLYLEFANNVLTHNAIKEFRPALGLKSIPFFLLKWFGAEFIFWLMKLIPNTAVKKFVYQ